MPMKKSFASSYKMLLRLARPLIHFVLLLVAFRIAYTVRQSTDLIPWLQLRIPAFNLVETTRFALIAVVIFLIAAFLLGVYELQKPLHGYYRKFLLAWVWWLVSMTFLALFGNGFLFTDGISRFVILWTAVCGLILLSIFDIFRNNLNSFLEKKHPYKILLIYNTREQYEQFVANIE